MQGPFVEEPRWRKHDRYATCTHCYRLQRADPKAQALRDIFGLDHTVQNADGTTDIYFGPKSPGEGKNWLATISGKGWFTIFRLYGPKEAFFDKTWKLNDIEKVK
jgi:hypothetical protein